jgi:hypothetical protein
MIPLNELKAPAVGCVWHEVAALVLDAATALDEQPASDLADLSAITLSEEGYVALPSGSERPWPVLQLAGLLQLLLVDVPAPDALRAIAPRYLSSPPTESSRESFLADLARFERPDRTGVLSQLAARAASVDRTVDGPLTLAQLASRVREQEAAVAAAPATRKADGRRRGVLTVVAIALAGATAAFVALAYIAAPPRPQGAEPQTVAARVEAGAAELVAAAARVLRPEPAPAPAAAPETATKPAARPGAARKRTAPRQAAADPVVSLRWVEQESQTSAPEPDAVPEPAPAPRDAVVYTSADADVTPAALLRPHLPSEPPSSVPPDEVGALELIVTETGQVAHVTLISAASRYQERMLVAAAKTWRFRPATKDGRAVRFRARVRITV